MQSNILYGVFERSQKGYLCLSFHGTLAKEYFAALILELLPEEISREACLSLTLVIPGA
jgi:hypothetical protein